ncbi:MAG TPA: aminotransferase class I/II-fold pyridoxal phosphate-dependent enzyme [Chryseolinea sp.]|nr:aminotransferase class I/II-fold pyridoxal phosphate-dependent enzyme [Chryseolinea sp.]
MIDLKLNYPSIEEEEYVIRDFVTFRKSAFSDLLKFPPQSISDEALAGVTKQLKLSSNILTQVSTVIECNGANHALSCVLQVLKKQHHRIIAEPFTYPAFKTLALANDFQLHASEFDTQGLTIEGLEKTVKESNATVIYLQPTIHNPTCAVMPLERRKSITEFAKRKNILIIEDDAYRFLHPDPPLSFLDLVPDKTFHIFSLSKSFNPLIKTAYLISPNFYSTAISEAVRLTSSGHSSKQTQKSLVSAIHQEIVTAICLGGTLIGGALYGYLSIILSLKAFVVFIVILIAILK